MATSSCCYGVQSIKNILILILIFNLSFGRYISWNYLYTFSSQLLGVYNLTNQQSQDLPEWYIWPNIIIDVFCGFSIDNLLDVKVSAVIFSFLSFLGSILFAVSYDIGSYWLAVFSRLIFGIGCESLFIIQLSFLAKYFTSKKIFISIAALFSYSNVMIYFGDCLMRVGLESGKYKLTTYLLTIAPLTSLLIAWCLFIFLKINNVQNNIDSQINYKRPRHFYLTFNLCLAVYMVTVLADMRYFTPIQYMLTNKYEIYLPIKFINILSLLYIPSYLLAGILLYFLNRNRLLLLQAAILGLVVSNLIIFISFINPFVFIFIQILAVSSIKLILVTFIFNLVPCNEYATAAGFICGVTNISVGLSDKIYTSLMNDVGLILLGLLNCIIVNAGAIFSWIICITYKYSDF